MFYKTPYDEELRFGDILIHQTTISSVIKPRLNTHEDLGTFQIDVKKPIYSIILTPCCAIKEQVVITPLLPINKYFYRTPYFAEDLTRINRRMLYNQAMPPKRLEKLSQEEIAVKKAQGLAYALLENFIYAENDMLEKYKIEIETKDGKQIKETNYYMIDFRNVSIINYINVNSKNGIFLANKIAQLTVEARSELREKISDFYGKAPEEDSVLIE